MSYWRVPTDMWAGKTVAILASGPSMSQEVADRVRAAGLPTIVINSTHRLAPWADVLYAADSIWWATCKDEVAGFAGKKVSIEQAPGIHPNTSDDVLVLRNTGNTGFDPDPMALRTGQHSGYQALHLAAHAGAARVLLLGYDMHGGHWHGNHPLPLTNSTSLLVKNRGKFYDLKAELSARDIEVINCTPGSALLAFHRASLESVLAVLPTLEAS